MDFPPLSLPPFWEAREGPYVVFDSEDAAPDEVVHHLLNKTAIEPRQPPSGVRSLAALYVPPFLLNLAGQRPGVGPPIKDDGDLAEKGPLPRF